MSKAVKSVGSYLGLSGDQHMGTADALSRQNYDIFNKIKTPEMQWFNYTPDDYVPEEMQFETISEDPLLRASQMQALEQLGDLAQSGMSDVDALGYEKARQLGSQQAKSGREAAMQNAEMRGVGGSGLEFATREIANQEGARNSQMAALQQAADSAKQRALYNQAYSQALGDQRSQDLSANKANTDIINQFNQANTQNRNQAQQMNQQNRADAFKYNQEGRQGTQQQNFQNQITKAEGMSGAIGQQRENALAKSAAQKQQGQALFNAGMQGAMMLSDETKKENIKQGRKSITEILECLEPYAYSYKDSKSKKADHAGIMAQDLEKSKMGKSLVVDTPHGKMVDGAKASGVALAALSDIHERLKKVEGA